MDVTLEQIAKKISEVKFDETSLNPNMNRFLNEYK
jgi:hypothetical protein